MLCVFPSLFVVLLNVPEVVLRPIVSLCYYTVCRYVAVQVFLTLCCMTLLL